MCPRPGVATQPVRAVIRLLCAEVGADGTSAVLRPSGELDINQQRDLELALTEACAGRPLTVVDLADVTLLDCSAVGVLLAGAERCRRQGHDFVVLNVHGLVARMSDEEFRRLRSTERGAVYADVQVDATDLSLGALTAWVADRWAL